ncbi:GCN5 family acetyltransferase [Paenibacillus amylolyticus]|uniref:GCN5 family acetyltransferase n=2 Tax=Paenibacillus amylolyticus TaxID=1451 RepID=A0A100VJW4_PAEAM|nr:GCN5 family acetyltransferase [Paenibacillus amylolyticus]
MNMTPFPELETKRLLLKEIRQSDSQDIFHIFSSDEVTKFYDVESFKNMKQAEALIQRWNERFENGQVIRWGIALKSDGRVIGTCGFHGWLKQHHKAAMGYELAPEFWQQGYMTEVAQEIVEYGFNNLELNRIEAFVEPENTGSRELLKKIGFSEEGILKENYYWKDRFVDNVIYAFLKKEYV